MSNRALVRLALLLGALAALLAPPAAGAASKQVEGLTIDGRPFSQASIQNLHAEFDQCGAAPNETSCVWSVEVVAVYASGDCAGEDSAVLWSSGEIVGNGSVDSGPQSISLACPGSRLILSQTYSKTYGPWEGKPPLVVSSGLTQSVDLLLESIKELEERIIRESPAALVEPMPLPPRFEVSPDCRSLYAGERRYAFAFKRIGCLTARNVAARAQAGSKPNGYRCARRADGGAKCVRVGRPEKYVEWRLPRVKP